MVAMSHRLRADISTSRRSGSVWGVFVREHRPVIAASRAKGSTDFTLCEKNEPFSRLNDWLDTIWSQWLVWCNRPWSWWSRGKKKKSYGCAPQIWWCSLLIVDDVSRLSAEIWQRCTEKDSKPNIFLSLTCGPAARLTLPPLQWFISQGSSLFSHRTPLIWYRNMEHSKASNKSRQWTGIPRYVRPTQSRHPSHTTNTAEAAQFKAFSHFIRNADIWISDLLLARLHSA